MPSTFLLVDDVTPASALAFGPTAAGATSAARVLHFWQSKGTPGGLLKNLSLQAIDPATELDSGVPWLDQAWISARVNGGANPGNVAGFVAPITAWTPLGAGRVLSLPDLPGNCAYYVEVRLHPPMRDGAPTEAVNFQINPIYNESVLPLAGALSDLGQGVISGIGDRTVTEWVDAPAVTATGTPDAVVHVAGGRTYLSNGAPFATTTADALTLNQNDSASAALTSGHEYKALISQPPGVELAAVVTKGVLAATGAGVVPALPAGNLLIAVVAVNFHSTASVILQTDISTFAASGRGKPSVGALLTVGIAALRAVLPGSFIANRSARTVAVPPSVTSYVWLGPDDAFSVSSSAAPPFSGAMLLCSAVADGTHVTSVTDLRTYFAVGAPGMNLAAFASNALALAGGLAAGQFYRDGGDPDHVCVVH